MRNAVPRDVKIPAGLTGRIYAEEKWEEEITFFSADVDLTMDRLPEGELLSLPGETIDPFTADEDAMNAFIEELYTRLLQLYGSLLSMPDVSAPEPSVPAAGGALMG